MLRHLRAMELNFFRMKFYMIFIHALFEANTGQTMVANNILSWLITI